MTFVLPKIQHKGQLISQVFIYMLLLVMIGLILVFGYKAINAIQGGASVVDELQFRTIISSDIEKFSTEYGSVEKKRVPVPTAYNAVCFVSTEAILNRQTDFDSGYSLLEDSVADGSKENLFLFGKDTRDVKKYYVGNISVKSTPGEPSGWGHCFHADKGEIKISYKGKGSYAELSEW